MLGRAERDQHRRASRRSAEAPGGAARAPGAGPAYAQKAQAWTWGEAGWPGGLCDGACARSPFRATAGPAARLIAPTCWLLKSRSGSGLAARRWRRRCGRPATTSNSQLASWSARVSSAHGTISPASRCVTAPAAVTWTTTSQATSSMSPWPPASAFPRAPAAAFSPPAPAACAGRPASGTSASCRGSRWPAIEPASARRCWSRCRTDCARRSGFCLELVACMRPACSPERASY